MWVVRSGQGKCTILRPTTQVPKLLHEMSQGFYGVVERVRVARSFAAPGMGAAGCYPCFKMLRRGGFLSHSIAMGLNS